MARKLVIEISIPSVPRFSNFSAVSSSWRRQVDQIASEKLYLFLSLILLVVSSLYTLSYHTVELAFINQHYAFRENRLVGFEVSFGTDVRKIAWLPVLFYCSPHHQLAIAAAYACIALSAVVCVFYLLAPRIKNPRSRLAILATFYIPTLVLAIVAFFYNFIEAAHAARVDSWMLHEYASPTKYEPYGAAWMDLESWTCSVRWRAHDHLENGRWVAARGVLDGLCDTAVRGRWMLVPLLVVLLVSAQMSWVVFRGKGKEVEKERRRRIRGTRDVENGKIDGARYNPVEEEEEEEEDDAERRVLLREEENDDEEDAESRPASDERVRLP